MLGLMTAVVVVESLAPFAIAGIDIKWPNDVLIESRKVAGILAEVVGAGDAQRVIVGVGVNLNHAGFPEDLAETATSVRMATGRVTEPGEFRTAFLDRFQDWYLRVLEKGVHEVIDRWQDLSSYAHGRRITVTVDDRVIEGDTAGLTSSGALRLRTPEGEMRTLIVGDVASVRVQKT